MGLIGIRSESMHWASMTCFLSGGYEDEDDLQSGKAKGQENDEFLMRQGTVS